MGIKKVDLGLPNLDKTEQTPTQITEEEYNKLLTENNNLRKISEIYQEQQEYKNEEVFRYYLVQGIYAIKTEMSQLNQKLGLISERLLDANKMTAEKLGFEVEK